MSTHALAGTFSWAISTQNATGVMPVITWSPCGSCCRCSLSPHGLLADTNMRFCSFNQRETPDDFVIATGECHRFCALLVCTLTCSPACLTCYSVREFCELAFARIGIILEWRGVGVSEVGVCKTTGQTRVLVDPRYFRPTEVRNHVASACPCRLFCLNHVFHAG